MTSPIILPDGTVKLSLPFGDRFIGKIFGDTYIKKINPELHKLHKNNSIGFNYELMEKGNFTYVKVFFGNQILETTRNFILQFGKVQTFYKQSFEKQVFLRLEDFSLERALKFEQSQTVQLGLFAESEVR